MGSNASAEMNSAIGKWISTTCCACFARQTVLRSKGFTISLPLLEFLRRLLGDYAPLRPPPPFISLPLPFLTLHSCPKQEFALPCDRLALKRPTIRQHSGHHQNPALPEAT